ncbi:hypothetical protein BEL04_08465 [Mucilaginibacter sp. PPCGB 2223]|uniref:ComEC/Rec2 family competence protein n=1 Tax=Mucilaginibacter sp. PPCGB 2223 TaxID=1886027 RepID=UPI0008247ACE|nr:MBL fold metallo-hydrolase [Mucilaginibacter sp. PPCGB 2223]OCX54281.1 hypothetical protein BEL04_08465 [Mucilaginibacter sp. PPCGB 2223]
MKKITVVLIALTLCLRVLAQEELRIHHINVEDGDATLIGIYDVATHHYKSTILIDGGASNPNDLLLPYLRTVMATHVNYVVLTHYHKDHYNGLLALKDGRLTADSVIDPGAEGGPAAMEVATPWLDVVKTQHHSRNFVSFGTAKTSIGHKLTLGTAGGLPVVLECVAGWGNTLNGQGITPDPKPQKSNANNFTLAFVLTCGQFRYFIGGDLGGKTESEYIDQETALISDFTKEFPVAWSWNHTTSASGHLCGFKADHHGSEHSNNQAFMNSLSPAITITSAGKQPSWHLPSPAYLDRLAQVSALSGNRGVYFTNLYDFAHTPSKSTADSLFSHRPQTSYSYGNAMAGQKSSYLIKVPTANLANKSAFQVYRVDDAGARMTLLAGFQCHGK